MQGDFGAPCATLKRGNRFLPRMNTDEHGYGDGDKNVTATATATANGKRLFTTDLPAGRQVTRITRIVTATTITATTKKAVAVTSFPPSPSPSPLLPFPLNIRVIRVIRGKKKGRCRRRFRFRNIFSAVSVYIRVHPWQKNVATFMSHTWCGVNSRF